MIDASRGVLAKACEMCEQPTPHLLLQHEYWTDSTGTGQRKGGLAIISKFMIGSNHTKVVIFGNGNVKPSMGAHGGKLGTLNKKAPHRKLCLSNDYFIDLPLRPLTAMRR